MRQGIQFFVSILLARLLAPEDFGVIALLYIFISVAGIFVDSGFGSALIQRQNITLTDESTVFYFNLGMAALMSSTLCMSASLIAEYFNVPVVQSLVYLMALNLFIGAFGSIHNTLLIKSLDLKTIMKVGGVATFVSGTIAVLVAWQGYGVWSLVWQTLVSTIVSVILLWKWHPWRPLFLFSFASLRSLFKFGSYMALSGIIDTIYTQLYAVLIGKLFSTRELGYYTRAESTQQLPVGVLTRVLNRVALPILSEAAVDTSYLTRGVRKILVTTMLINVPIMLGLAVLAEQLVVTLFGVKWLPSVPFLQVLCLAGVIWPLHVINLNALMAQGRSDLFFRIEMIKKLVGIPLLVLASWHSILAIAWAVVVQGLFAFLINAHYSKMLLGYGALRQVQDVVPYVGVGLLMTVSVWWGSHVLDFPPAAELAILSIVGAAVYFLSCYLLHLAAVEEVVAVIKRGSRS